MKILVTGGAGFIGSNLISTLLKNNSNEIVCFDNLVNSYPRKIRYRNIKEFKKNKQFNFIKGDICNANDVKKIPRGIDIIIHLAAKTNVRSSFDNADIYFQINIQGTRQLLEFARIRNIKKVIFASSSNLYGKNPNVPWSEEDEAIPNSPYALSKLEGEKLGLYYSKYYNIQFIALRFFNVYGPGQRPDLVINKFFKSILNNQPVKVYGDGLSLRDYTFISDVIGGIVSAMKYQKSNFEIINLGRQQAIRLVDLIYEIENICKKKAVIKFLPPYPGEIDVTYSSNSKAKHLLNYQPKITLRNGLTKYYNWLHVSEAVDSPALTFF